MKNKIIGPGKPKRVSKSPWAELENGTKEPTNNVMGKESPK